MARKTIYSAAYRDLVLKLRQLREAAGLSQGELARKLDWPQQRLSAVESGSRRLDVMEFLQLTAALGLDPVSAISLVTEAQTPSGKR